MISSADYIPFVSKMNVAKRLKDDVVCLKSMWFAKGGGETHAERLDNFYKPQAEECTDPLSALNPQHPAVQQLTEHVIADDKFRDRFLWGRRPMLAAVAARLPKPTDNVWVDLGGGTGVRSISLNDSVVVLYRSGLMC